MLLRAVLNILVKKAGPRGPMCFRCLIFSILRPYEFLFFALFYCLLDLSCGECNVISLFVFVLVCVLCLCDPSVRLDAPSIYYFCVLYVGSYLLI